MEVTQRQIQIKHSDTDPKRELQLYIEIQLDLMLKKDRDGLRQLFKYCLKFVLIVHSDTNTNTDTSRTAHADA